MTQSKPITERFFDKVRIPTDPDACWEWIAGKTSAGRPYFSICGNTQMLAYRFSYSFHTGGIPNGMLVLHTCDNPECCNPRHLFVGSHADNNRDMISKGRMRSCHGEGRANAKLTDKDIVEICKLHRSGDSGRKIAAKFGVSHASIRAVVGGTTWKHITSGQGISARGL